MGICEATYLGTLVDKLLLICFHWVVDLDS